jgi:Sigma-70 factor, region 1.1
MIYQMLAEVFLICSIHPAASRFLFPFIGGAISGAQHMERSEILRKVIVIAEATGRITFDQLNELLPARAEPEDVEWLMSALSDREIWIAEE